jgi:hypothetical protein
MPPGAFGRLEVFINLHHITITHGLLRAISELETGNWKLAVYASRLGVFYNGE